jgi:hypothetical protein
MPPGMKVIRGRGIDGECYHFLYDVARCQRALCWIFAMLCRAPPLSNLSPAKPSPGDFARLLYCHDGLNSFRMMPTAYLIGGTGSMFLLGGGRLYLSSRPTKPEHILPLQLFDQRKHSRFASPRTQNKSATGRGDSNGSVNTIVDVTCGGGGGGSPTAPFVAVDKFYL